MARRETKASFAALNKKSRLFTTVFFIQIDKIHLTLAWSITNKQFIIKP